MTRFALIAAVLAAVSLTVAGVPHAQVLEIGDDGVVRTLGVVTATARVQPARVAPLTKAVAAAAAQYGLAPELIDAVARQESGYRAGAVSPKGALGVMQLMPATARALGVDARDPVAGVFGGAAYLRAQLDRFDGRVDLALAAYNAGPGAVARHCGVPPYRETQGYVASNLARLAKTSFLAAPLTDAVNTLAQGADQ